MRNKDPLTGLCLFFVFYIGIDNTSVRLKFTNTLLDSLPAVVEVLQNKHRRHGDQNFNF